MEDQTIGFDGRRIALTINHTHPPSPFVLISDLPSTLSFTVSFICHTAHHVGRIHAVPIWPFCCVFDLQFFWPKWDMSLILFFVALLSGRPICVLRLARLGQCFRIKAIFIIYVRSAPSPLVP